MTFASTLPVIDNYLYYAQLGIMDLLQQPQWAAKSDIVTANVIYIVYSIKTICKCYVMFCNSLEKMCEEIKKYRKKDLGV